MLTGPILTLNFYSNPIDVILEDRIVYVNWDHLRQMTGRDYDIAPHLISRGPEESLYVSLSFLDHNIKDFTSDLHTPLFGTLVRDTFFQYIASELGLIRDLVPLIDLDYDIYSSGIFEYNGEHYFTEAAVKRLLGIDRVTIPTDVPRYPAILSIDTSTPRHYGLISVRQAPSMMPVWIMDLDSLPYVLRANRDVKHAAFGMDDRRDSMSYALKVSKDSPLGRHLKVSLNELGPGQRFDSPGEVGEHRCELDPEQIQAVQARDALLKSSRWPDQKEITRFLLQDDPEWRDENPKTQASEEPMTWVGSRLTLKSEL